MGFLDNLTKTITHGVDRAKFEADKFQKTTRIQGELNDLKKQADGKLQELGQRAYDLFRAGQISTPSIGALAQELEAFRGSLLAKEEELKAAQIVTFVEPPPPAPSAAAQQVPISHDPAPQAASVAAGNKLCPSCRFQMPASAMFCPNCGTRVNP